MSLWRLLTKQTAASTHGFRNFDGYDSRFRRPQWNFLDTGERDLLTRWRVARHNPEGLMTLYSEDPASVPAAQTSASRVAVIIATKGRPATVPWVMRLLARQTVVPDLVIFSATQKSDVGAYEGANLEVRCIFGTPGLPTQRNRALDALPVHIKYVIFFDDDFVPSRHWIKQCVDVFEANPSVIGLSGRTLRDGAKLPVSWGDAVDIVHSSEDKAIRQSPLEVCTSLYGCNMAYRVDAIQGVRFDERLVLYGWLEDQDFGRRLSGKGKLVRCNHLLGVHLGLASGRVSGKKFGYSQIVNAVYLHRKGVLSRREATSNSFRALGVNFVKSIRPEVHVDRRGRLIGNFIGVADICSGSVNPERALDL